MHYCNIHRCGLGRADTGMGGFGQDVLVCHGMILDEGIHLGYGGGIELVLRHKHAEEDCKGLLAQRRGRLW